MSIHYRLGHHAWDDANYEYFQRRFRRFFGDSEGQLDHLVALSQNTELPIKERLGALGGVGVLAHQSQAALAQLERRAESDDFNFVFSSCIIRACWLGKQEGLDDLVTWMKREAVREPPNPQFVVDAPGHHGNPIFVLRRFTFPYLFGLDPDETWKKNPSIAYWIEFYEAKRERLKFDPAKRRYTLATAKDR